MSTGQAVEWQLRHPPRRWQAEALSRWLASGSRGVAAVVTGAGKTYFAMQCIVETLCKYPGSRILIAVPTVALLDQWRVALVNELGIQDSEVSCIGGGTRSVHGRIVLGVLDSLRRRVEHFVKEGQWFLIVDECHRAASSANRVILQQRYFATLGLSATPERQYDPWFEQFIIPRIGPVIYRYDHVQAYSDGVIVPFELRNIRVPLSPDEKREVDSINKSIRREIQTLRNKNLLTSDRLRRLLILRSRRSQEAVARVWAALALISEWRGKRGIVFFESVNSANVLADLLRQRGIQACVYHSGMASSARYLSLRLFAIRQVDLLIACRALDEGLDIPHAEFGILAASTNSHRQRVQRLGRVLRPSKGKERAVVATLYALPSEGALLREEAQRLEGVARVRWYEAGVR